MDRKEYQALLGVIEQTIETSELKGAEQFMGYRQDTHSHGLGRLEETAQEHNPLYNESDVDSGDPYLDAISRLNRDCCKGIKTKDI